jgi:hypothetical protein
MQRLARKIFRSDEGEMKGTLRIAAAIATVAQPHFCRRRVAPVAHGRAEVAFASGRRLQPRGRADRPGLMRSGEASLDSRTQMASSGRRATPGRATRHSAGAG